MGFYMAICDEVVVRYRLSILFFFLGAQFQNFEYLSINLKFIDPLVK